MRMSFVSLAGDGPLCSPLWTQRGHWMETPVKTAVFPTACVQPGRRRPPVPWYRNGRPCIFCASSPARFRVVCAAWRGLSAFLDSRPVFKGHCWWCRAPTTTTSTRFRRRRWPVLDRGSAHLPGVEAGLERRNVRLPNNKISQSVPHLHTHVVPTQEGRRPARFLWPRTKYDSTPSAKLRHPHRRGVT